MLAASVAENVKQRSRVRLSVCPSVFIVFQRYASALYAVIAHCFSLNLSVVSRCSIVLAQSLLLAYTRLTTVANPCPISNRNTTTYLDR